MACVRGRGGSAPLLTKGWEARHARAVVFAHRHGKCLVPAPCARRSPRTSGVNGDPGSGSKHPHAMGPPPPRAWVD